MARMGWRGTLVLAVLVLTACRTTVGVDEPMVRSKQCWWGHTCFDISKTASRRAAKIFLDYKGSYEPFSVQVRTNVTGMDGNRIEEEIFVLKEPRRIPVLDVVARSNERWNWTWDFSQHPGSSPAAHDDRIVYRLPYRDNETYTIIQGYGGESSHSGDNFHSIDWEMPVGTAVLAARGGVVVATREDSDRRGQGWDNHVIIRHADGTYAWYMHLERDGAVTEPGQTVAAGDLIGFSGNTGFSSRPHLHFQVSSLSADPDKFYVSYPTLFLTSRGLVSQLQEGGRYTAVPLPEN